MKPQSAETITFTKEFTRQEPIPDAGIKRALELMKSGRMHRYNTAAGEISEVSLLEKEYADCVGARYCLGLSSCGSSIYVALKSVGVTPGDKVLCNVFTLAPVPGAIENAGAVPVFVEITEDYVGSSLQFTLTATEIPKVLIFLKTCAERGVEIKWFGAKEPVGFTSSWESWQYVKTSQ